MINGPQDYVRPTFDQIFFFFLYKGLQYPESHIISVRYCSFVCSQVLRSLTLFIMCSLHVPIYYSHFCPLWRNLTITSLKILTGHTLVLQICIILTPLTHLLQQIVFQSGPKNGNIPLSNVIEQVVNFFTFQYRRESVDDGVLQERIHKDNYCVTTELQHPASCLLMMVQ